jgi:acetyl-CoA acyltransferase
MTRVPIMGFNPMPHPGLVERMPQAYISMGETRRTSPSCTRCRAARRRNSPPASHRKAAAAQAEGRFAEEIVPVEAAEDVSADGCIRPDTTPETLAGLKPAFREGGSVTGRHLLPLTDGAAAVMVCSAEFARGERAGAAGADQVDRRSRLRAGDHGHGPERHPRRRWPRGPHAARA